MIKNKISEHQIQSNFFRIIEIDHFLKKYRNLIFSIPNGGARSAITGAMLKREGVAAGVPDVFVAVPTQDYSGFFIEFKTKKGIISDKQREFMKNLQNAGYKVEVYRDEIEAIERLSEYLSPVCR